MTLRDALKYVWYVIKKKRVWYVITDLIKNRSVSGTINRLLTNLACEATTPRPRAFSLWSHLPKPPSIDQQGPVGEYTTWPMLTDRRYSTRHLPPADQSYIDALPEDTPYRGDRMVGNVTALFARGDTMKEGRSSVLFMFFAQWFTDSVLRIDPRDRRKNTSNHNIDLCQIYGLTEETARLLRSGSGGKLTSQQINGEEYLDYLGEVGHDGKWQVKEKYKELPYASPKIMNVVFEDWTENQKHKLYAAGLERGNSSIGYIALSTLFMREHNRICIALSHQHETWDDERLFQTARMINIVILIKLVVQDYINHIAGYKLFAFDTAFAEKEEWYRLPWVSLEFDLLYRWHGLVPDHITVAGQQYDDTRYLGDNALLEQLGVAKVVDAASRQRAGQISLRNVPTFLLGAEYETIKMGRDFRLRPYNEYRRQFGLDVLTSFDQLTDDTELQDELKSMYRDIDKVEFVIGLFAQKHTERRLYGDLLYAMVAYDAFTQIYPNPLLSRNVYTVRTFTEYGLKLIDETNSVEDLVRRNVGAPAGVEVRFGW